MKCCTPSRHANELALFKSCSDQACQIVSLYSDFKASCKNRETRQAGIYICFCKVLDRVSDNCSVHLSVWTDRHAPDHVIRINSNGRMIQIDYEEMPPPLSQSVPAPCKNFPYLSRSSNVSRPLQNLPSFPRRRAVYRDERDKA